MVSVRLLDLTFLGGRLVGVCAFAGILHLCAPSPLHLH